MLPLGGSLLRLASQVPHILVTLSIFDTSVRILCHVVD